MWFHRQSRPRRRAFTIAAMVAVLTAAASALIWWRFYIDIEDARDDGYGTYANSQYAAARIANATFTGYDSGGHLWVRHDAAVRAEILKRVITHPAPPEPAGPPGPAYRQ